MSVTDKWDIEFAVETIAAVMEGVVGRSAAAATARDGEPHADVTGYEDRQAAAVVAAIQASTAAGANLRAALRRTGNPPSSPAIETEPLAGTTSYTGVIRPADEAVALTWLEIGAATREGIAKEIEAQMKYEGVRAQRVMAMCAGIARTWKP